MEDNEKRALVAVAASLLVLAVWSWFFAPPPPEPRPTPPPIEGTIPQPGSPHLGSAEIARPEPDEGSEGAEAATVDVVAAESEAETVIRTDLYEVTLTNRGGRVLSWRLLAYVDREGEPVELVSPDARAMNRLPLSVWLPGRDDLARRADEALFVMELEPSPTGSGQRVRMRFVEGSGFSVEKTLELRHGSYFLEASASVAEGGRALPAWLTWGAGFGEIAEGAENGNTFFKVGQAVVNRAGGVKRIAKGKYSEITALDGEEPILWAGMETTYFAALMIPAAPARRAVLLPAEHRIPPPPGEEGDGEVEQFLGIALEPGGSGSGAGRYSLFVGPKDYHLLRAEGHDLVAVINFGWPVIREIAQGLFIALTWLYGYIGNYGVAIILLTLVIRVGFFPLMYHTQIKMRRMQQKTKKIQPKMKAIKERYRKAKSDFQSRQKMNDEIMGLYRKEGINPLGGLGGCLPLLIQLPFLYGFYQLLRETIELRQAPFMGWIQDLSQPDPLYITPLLMGVSMLVQTKMSMSNMADPNQRRMMTVMSVVFTVFFLNLPSGLVLYWFVSNLLGIGQQYLVNRKADHDLELQKLQKSPKSQKSKKPQKPRGDRAASR